MTVLTGHFPGGRRPPGAAAGRPGAAAGRPGASSVTPEGLLLNPFKCFGKNHKTSQFQRKKNAGQNRHIKNLSKHTES